MDRQQAEKLCGIIEKAVTETVEKWDESQHPRDENGRFASGDSSNSDVSDDWKDSDDWYKNLSGLKMNHGYGVRVKFNDGTPTEVYQYKSEKVASSVVRSFSNSDVVDGVDMEEF